MIKSRAVLAASLLAFAGAASADITITPTLTSDYDFRGISQMSPTIGAARDWAFQLGLTYTGEGGAYMGMWGSNVDKLSPNNEPNTKYEVDVFSGYAGGDAKDGYGYDVGLIYYTYPNQGSLNFPEFYTGFSKGPLSAKIWYSWNFKASGDTAVYYDANLNMPAGDGFSVLFHAGYSGGEYWTAMKKQRLGEYNGLGRYTDWSLGFAAQVKGATMSVRYADGSDLNVNKPGNLGRIIFSISKPFTTAK